MAKAVLDAALSAAYEKRKRAMKEYEELDREFRLQLASTCRSARSKRGLTQDAVAAKVGGTHVTLSHLEAARRSGCGIDKAEQILKVLGVRFR